MLRGVVHLLVIGVLGEDNVEKIPKHVAVRIPVGPVSEIRCRLREGPAKDQTQLITDRVGFDLLGEFIHGLLEDIRLTQPGDLQSGTSGVVAMREEQPEEGFANMLLDGDRLNRNEIAHRVRVIRRAPVVVLHSERAKVDAFADRRPGMS